jgi:ankyrin repeat protein
MDEYLENFLAELCDEAGFNDEPIGPETLARTGDRPLHIAAIRGDVKALCLLLETGVDLNAKGEGGMTPLHYAAGHNRAEALASLLTAGADTALKDDDDFTPLDLARILKEDEMVRMLLAHGAPGSEDYLA